MRVHEGFYDGTSMGEHFARNPVLDVQRQQIRRHLAPDPRSHMTVLDLGCGGGTTTVELFGGDERYDIVGGDVSPTALATYARRTGNPAVRLDAERLPFADDRFDVVVADDVVEHLVDTDAFARELHRVLRPDGWLLLTTPNLAAWFNRLALLGGVQPAFSEVSFERVFGRPGDDIVGHLRLFTSRSIVAFLEHHRFTLVEHRGAAFDALPRKLGPLDRLIAHRPRFAANTVLIARPA
jgi:SAM-dependent methyltransferase